MKIISKVILWALAVFILLFVVVIFGPQDEASVAEQHCKEQVKIAGQWVPKHSAEYRMQCMEQVRRKYGARASAE